MPGDRFIELAQAEDRHVLDVLYRHALEAVMVQDRDGGLVYANDRAAELVALTSGPDMMAGAGSALFPSNMIDETGQPIGNEDLPGSRVLAGETPEEMTVGYVIRGSKKVRWSRVNARPIKNDAGEVVWAINFFLDITEDFRQREGEVWLAKVNDALAPAVTIDEHLRALVRVLADEVPGLAEVHLADQRGGLVLAASAGQLSEVDPGVDRAPSDIDSARLQERVMNSGIPELVVPGPGGGQADTADAGLSRICVRLGTSGRGGTLTLTRGPDQPSFDAEDLALVRRVGSVASIGLANARLYELEHETAEALRANLTPNRLPSVPRLEFAFRYVPMMRLGHIGGDFFDIVPQSDSSCVVLVGDIEGKGVPAAAAVGMARDTMRATIKLRPEPDVVLSQLNDALLDQDQPRMCTVAYVRVELTETGADLRISLAGHPPPASISRDGTIQFPGIPCPPAGLMSVIRPTETVVAVGTGDTLLLYTDGYAIPDETPMETVARFAKGGAEESLDSLLDRMLQDRRSVAESVRDDILLLAVRVA